MSDAGPAEAFHRVSLGEHRGTVISDGDLLIAPRENIFTGISKTVFQLHLAESGRPTDVIHLGQNAFVLERGKEVTLFETGLGRYKRYGPHTGQLGQNLRLAGYQPDDVTAVAITHAHSDHCWGLLDADNEPVYPNARIFISQVDFDYFTAEQRISDPEVVGARDQLMPLRDSITLLDDGTEFLSGIRAWSTPGHTPGHMAFHIDAGEPLVIVGDVLHYPFLEMADPSLENPLDHDPSQAAATRAHLLASLADRNLRFVAYHFPWPGIGRVSRAGGGFVFHPEA